MLGLDMPPGQPLTLGFQIQTLFQNFISIYINKNSVQSLQWLSEPDQNFGCFGHARGLALEPNIWKFKTLSFIPTVPKFENNPFSGYRDIGRTN